MLLSVLQENLLCLLIFSDDKAPIVRNTIEINLFGGQYKIIANKAYDYIDKYKRAPKQHIADILQDKLESQNKAEASLYNDILTSLHEAYSTINTEYVMAQLETFVKRQSLRTVAIELAKALQRDTE